MTQHRPYNQPKKLDYIKEKVSENNKNLTIIEKVPDFRRMSAHEYVKNSHIVYESDWTVLEHEDIPEATSTEENTLLPERAKYEFTGTIAITDELLPYLKPVILVKSNADVTIQNVFSYTRSGYMAVQFHLYDWQGITYTSGCGAELLSPNPSELYTAGVGYGFKYPQAHFPVPVSENPVHVLPGERYIGADNAVCACEGCETPGQYWEDSGVVTFNGLLAYYSYEDAVDVVNDWFDDVLFTTNPPYDAFELVSEERVNTAHQKKVFTKKNDQEFDFEISGDMLQISPATTETDYSHVEYKTYKASGVDFEVKLMMYYINPNTYSEGKIYVT